MKMSTDLKKPSEICNKWVRQIHESTMSDQQENSCIQNSFEYCSPNI